MEELKEHLEKTTQQVDGDNQTYIIIKKPPNLAVFLLPINKININNFLNIMLINPNIKQYNISLLINQNNKQQQK